jgi:hypothetical protein
LLSLVAHPNAAALLIWFSLISCGSVSHISSKLFKEPVTYPPLLRIVGSVTTSVAMVSSVASMVLPTLIVGNELVILGVVWVGGWRLVFCS